MEGSPAHGKHHHQCGDDLQQTLFLLVLLAQVVEVACDGAADEAVEDGHGQERKEETQSRGGEAEPCDPEVLMPPVPRHQAEVHGTRGPVAVLVVHCGAKEQCGNSQQA